MRAEWSFFLLTFGCKVNQYETQAVREAWLRYGGRETDDPAGADVALLNTCAVTANAVTDARQAVRRLHRLVPALPLVVAGCACSAAREDLLALPGVVAALAPERKADLLDPARFFACIGLREDAASVCLPEEGRVAATETAPAAARGATGEAAGAFPPFSITGFRRARPVLKVQDGCSRACAYCIVPLARGPSRSRSAEDCLAEARRLLGAGYREIMLSGINLGQYRDPQGGAGDFWELLRLLDRALTPEWAGVARLRISSVDPAQLLDDRCPELLAEARMICPHLHVSLQSGSPDVLRAMRRPPFAPERLAEAVGRIARAAGRSGRFGLGADILTGFPGESEAHAAQTLDLVDALPLTYAHVFPYSIRPGTAAAGFAEQVPTPVRRERAARVRALIEAKRRAFWQASLEAGLVRVAPEGDGSPKGVDECYVPCRLVEPVPEGSAPPGEAPGGQANHALLEARPVAVTREGLLVEAVARPA